jgi:hypothetical protein
MPCSPLDLAVVQALDERIPSLRASAQAWLGAYHLALSLGFTERTAVCQAAAAWDRVVAAWRQPSQDPRFELTESGRGAIHRAHV